jgi:mRNA-degrading endonuclease RelE of RelBE toxin-antitoxin system
MMADTRVTLYGIVHAPGAWEAIQHANAASQQPLHAAIITLQTNPRPAERESEEDYSAGVSSIMVRITNPPYRITYEVDDEARRVVILAVSEARWSQ